MNIIQNDTRLFIVLLAVSFISVYFMPAAVNRIIFLILLYTAYRTRLDYVYLVWFFIINDAPGRLFSAGEFAESARIPLYPVIPGVSIGFQDLFLLVYIIKYLQLQPRPHFILQNAFRWFLVVGLVYVIYSLFIGMNLNNIVGTGRALLSWCFVFIVPAFLSKKEILVRSGLLLFPFVLLAFASVIFVYNTGKYFDFFLRGVDIDWALELEEGRLSRSYSAFSVILLSIILALYFIVTKIKELNQNYLILIIFIGYLTVILSGIRGWIISITLLLLGAVLLLVMAGKIPGFIRLAAITAGIFFITVIFYPPINEQIQLAFDRVSTVGAIAEGDVTAGGTLQRIDLRAPRVMNKFYENPILGWGFSTEYYRYRDGHVGHPSILLNIGIVGYVYINALFIYLCFIILNLVRNRQIREHEGNAPIVFLLGLIAVFVIHSSSMQFWGYSLGMGQTLVFGFLFAAVNTIYLHYHENYE